MSSKYNYEKWCPIPAGRSSWERFQQNGKLDLGRVGGEEEANDQVISYKMKYYKI